MAASGLNPSDRQAGELGSYFALRVYNLRLVQVPGMVAPVMVI